MSEMESLKRALARAKKAKQLSEELLENKSRELFYANQDLQKQIVLLGRRNQALEMFSSIVHITDEQEDDQQILQSFIEIFCTTYEWTVGHIVWLQDTKETNKVELVSSSIGFQSLALETADVKVDFSTLQYPKQKCLVDDVWRNGQIIWHDALPTNYEIGQLGALNLNSCLGVPIYRYNFLVAVAVAEFYSIKTIKRTKSMLSIIDMVATQIGTIMERHYSRTQLTQNYHQLQEMYRELKSTQQKLVQSSKMASIGQMAAGIAHEINNPIAFISSNTTVLEKYSKLFKELLDKYDNLLERQAEPEVFAQLQVEISQFKAQNNMAFIAEDLELLLKDSLEGMDRVSSIVAGLKNFARMHDVKMQLMDVNECILSAIKLVWNQIKYSCAVKKQLQAASLIECHPGQLTQVVINLIINASQAMTDKGNITIRSYEEDNWIIVKIEDDGNGIPEENISKLFDPFFTTKPIGTGTGLGLSICFGIIEKHHGKISVSSELGRGTCFTLSLPCATQ